MDLDFTAVPFDLMEKFIDTLARLPNLRTLNLLSVSHRGPATAGLNRKCAKFPNIREMTICPEYPEFVKSCPNLESLNFGHGFTRDRSTAIDICGAGLKRVTGVDISMDPELCCEFVNPSPNLKQPLNDIDSDVVEYCPKLREIGLFDGPGVSPLDKQLRKFSHLTPPDSGEGKVH